MPEVVAKAKVAGVFGPSFDVPPNETFTSLFHETARKHGDLVALSAAWPDESIMTYERAALIARGIAVQVAKCFPSGKCKDAMVGILSARGIEFMCALLGIVTAGAAFVPINPILPEQRITWMLEDTEAPVLCVSRAAASAVPNDWNGTQLVLEDAIAQAPALADQAKSLAPPQPQDLMYVIFTSGSTGRPKGVLLEHRMALNVGLPFITGTVPGTVRAGPVRCAPSLAWRGLPRSALLPLGRSALQ